jgi:hypothetical protein
MWADALASASSSSVRLHLSRLAEGTEGERSSTVVTNSTSFIGPFTPDRLGPGPTGSILESA